MPQYIRVDGGLRMRQTIGWCVFILQITLLAPRASALVPKYYTDFEIVATSNATLLDDLYAFLAELCLTVPSLPCAAQQNVTVTFADS